MISVSNLVNVEKKVFTGIVNAFLPKSVVIPFVQERSGKACIPLVEKGDTVAEGQIIGSSEFAAVHASVPGTVTDIFLSQVPDGRQALSARIRLNGAFSFTGKKQTVVEWQQMDRQTITDDLASKGVVNTFFSGRPEALSRQISECADIVLVRLFDEDPSCCVDSVLSRLYEKEIRTGAAIIAQAMGASGIVFAVARQHGGGQIQDDMFGSAEVRQIQVNTRQYPCSGKRELCAAVRAGTSSDVFKHMGLNSLFVDALTALHVYEAVVLSEPVIYQYVHVSGKCLRCSGIFRLAVGTQLSDLSELCGGFIKEPAKIIINGVLSGGTVSSYEVPVTAYVKSVSFMTSHDVPEQRQTTCVRCGRCRTVCPRGLCPDILYRSVAYGVPVEQVYIKTANLCVSCALCNAFCPARLPLTQTIALLKDGCNE